MEKGPTQTLVPSSADGSISAVG
ncbi:uncharacterized protein METZ01_LOCUS45401 [marine metagenome]|uniref:Uncharacterized protein n=1 Tax=marine metagenome TaxID=408172 RepID=A0A381RRL5_9ZZZZ